MDLNPVGKKRPLENFEEPVDLVVLGLDWQITTCDLGKYFERFGKLAHVQVMNNHRGKPAGFGFIKFLDIHVQNLILKEFPYHFIGKRRCEVRMSNRSKQQKRNKAQKRTDVDEVNPERLVQASQSEVKIEESTITDVDEANAEILIQASQEKEKVESGYPPKIVIKEEEADITQDSTFSESKEEEMDEIQLKVHEANQAFFHLLGIDMDKLRGNKLISVRQVMFNAVSNALLDEH